MEGRIRRRELVGAGVAVRLEVATGAAVVALTTREDQLLEGTSST